jgi:hypothetical protein
VTPYHTKPHIHCCTDKLDLPDVVDLDWFTRIIFTEHYLCGIDPRIGGSPNLKANIIMRVQFEGIIIFNESFPYSVMQSIGAQCSALLDK